MMSRIAPQQWYATRRSWRFPTSKMRFIRGLTVSRRKAA